MPTLQDLVQNFGVTEPFGVPGPYGDIHTGVDLGLPAGTPVPSLGSGMIENVFVDGAGGTQVKVRYASGWQGWFAHLSDVYVQSGDYVDANTIIGASGATGHVTGPHLHFELHDQSGQLVDPLSDSASSFATYIGGGSSPATIGDHPAPAAATTPQCGTGFVWDPATGKCRNANITDVIPSLDIGKGVGDAVTKFGDDLARGAKQIAIAGVIIGAVVILGYGGLKQIAD